MTAEALYLTPCHCDHNALWFPMYLWVSLNWTVCYLALPRWQIGCLSCWGQWQQAAFSCHPLQGMSPLPEVVMPLPGEPVSTLIQGYKGLAISAKLRATLRSHSNSLKCLRLSLGWPCRWQIGQSFVWLVDAQGHSYCKRSFSLDVGPEGRGMPGWPCQ